MRMGLLPIALLCLFIFTVPAHAHKISVFAWVEGNTVRTESIFIGGKKVKSGKIEIYDQENRIVLEGTTDDKGRYDFPAPSDATALKIVISDGMGHANHWRISAEELSGKSIAKKPTTDVQPQANSTSSPLDAAAIEQIVERAVAKEVAPIRAQLAQQSWGFRDIVAGVGYILGLMGLASYIHHRKAANVKD